MPFFVDINILASTLAYNIQKKIAQKQKAIASMEKYIFLLQTVIPKGPFREMYEVLLTTSANLNELLQQARGQTQAELEEQMILVQELIGIIDEGLKSQNFHSNKEVRKRVTDTAIHMALFAAVKLHERCEELSKQPPLQKLFKIIDTLSKSIAERSREDIQTAEDGAGIVAEEALADAVSISPYNKNEFDAEAKLERGVLKKPADATTRRKKEIEFKADAKKSIVRAAYTLSDDTILNLQTRLVAYAELYNVLTNPQALEDAVKERECLFIGAGVATPDATITTEAVPVGVQTLRDIGAIDATDNIHNKEGVFDWINVKTAEDLSDEPTGIGFVREEIIAHMKSLGFEGNSPEKIPHMLALDAAIYSAGDVVAKKLDDECLEIFSDEMRWFFSSIYKTPDSIFIPGSFEITPKFLSRLVLEIRQSKAQLIESLQEYMQDLQSEQRALSASLKALNKRISDYEGLMFDVLGGLAGDDSYAQFLYERQELVSQIQQLKISLKQEKNTLLAVEEMAPEIADTAAAMERSDCKSGPAPLLLPPVARVTAVTEVAPTAVMGASISSSSSAMVSSSAFFAPSASLKPTKSVVVKSVVVKDDDCLSVQPAIDPDLEPPSAQFSELGI